MNLDIWMMSKTEWVGVSQIFSNFYDYNNRDHFLTLLCNWQTNDRQSLQEYSNCVNISIRFMFIIICEAQPNE